MKFPSKLYLKQFLRISSFRLKYKAVRRIFTPLFSATNAILTIDFRKRRRRFDTAFLVFFEQSPVDVANIELV